MDINDLLQALFRWIHFIAGITWIGMLYFFNLINAHVTAALQPATRREVVPQLMPRALWWFRWGAMVTFITGLLLIIWKYFLLGSGFTGDAGLFGSDAGLWISMGALFGIIMWFNVWFIIWPAQQKLITWTKEGQTPPEQPATAKRALYASRTNVFLSVPMLFGMLAGAGHYPSIAFMPWFIVVIVLGAGLAYYMIFSFSPTVARTWP
ncbi:MAG TPA: urate hydroxylase PuuD [Methylomirabilota bacterium]|nr:urate hydroxylase PuuD [Methylomirabilota bacterium]